MSEIKNPWCVYGSPPGWVGKVEEESPSCNMVRYSEGQMYPLEAWDKRYVKRFQTPKEAISFLAKYEDEPESELIERFKQNFPSARSLVWLCTLMPFLHINEGISAHFIKIKWEILPL